MGTRYAYPETERQNAMSYLTMCQNKECKLRLSCYRFLAKPGEIQSYHHFVPVKVADHWECAHQIPNPDYCAKIETWKPMADFEVK